MKNNQNYTRLFWTLLLIFSIILIIGPIGLEHVFARPGGGHGFSGGGGYSGGGSSGGGGGGDGDLIILILSMLPPEISVPLVIAIIVFRIIQQRRKKKNNGAVISAPTVVNRVNANNQTQNTLQQLLQRDANFSKVVFLDFAASVFYKYYVWYGKPEFRFVAPFFAPTEAENSKRAQGQNQSNSEIVVGAMNIKNISFSGGYDTITLEIDANYTNTHQGKATRFSVYERWHFMRKSGLQSLAPETMRSVACPNCGAVSSFTDNGDCSSCGTHLPAGEQQWFVSNMAIIDRKYFSTQGMAHYAEERGTNFPTIYQNGLSTQLAEFGRRNGVNLQAWQPTFANDIVAQYFMKIYAAWSANKLSSVRNLLSDRTFESFMFWISAYKSAGLTNKLENIKIAEIQIVRVDLDKLYDSVTVRIFASALDFVTDAQGNVKGGNARKPREYSEYWTFIRRFGVKKEAFDTNTCPSCGAPADNMGQAGECGYCGNKVSNGDFSWVLAIITQDEVYGG